MITHFCLLVIEKLSCSCNVKHQEQMFSPTLLSIMSFLSRLYRLYNVQGDTFSETNAIPSSRSQISILGLILRPTFLLMR